MKIAIHNKPGSFSDRWIAYCDKNQIDYKLVNCLDTNIVEQIRDCEIVMWHHSQSNTREILVAKSILFALQHSGKVVFPNFETNWHFDDKVGQKYLLESLDIQLVPSYTFYSIKDATSWINKTEFPKVFKLRGGAGSENVMLANNKSEAKKLVRRAFGRGFKQYSAWSNLKERWRLYRIKKTNLWDVIKGVIRLFYEPEFSKIIGPQRGYIYFQDFIPKNDFDIRIIVIDEKAFAIKRMVRENDFRASGSGIVLYEKEHFDDKTVKIGFEIARKLKGQSVAIDFVYDNGVPMIVEISYPFIKEVYDPCVGYWDKNMTWNEVSFDPYGWMVDMVVRDYEQRLG